MYNDNTPLHQNASIFQALHEVMKQKELNKLRFAKCFECKRFTPFKLKFVKKNFIQSKKCGNLIFIHKKIWKRPLQLIIQKEQEKIIKILKNYISQNQSKIVKTFSMQTLANFAEKDESIRPTIIDLIEEIMKTSSPRHFFNSTWS